MMITYMKFKSFETEIFQTERDRRVGGVYGGSTLQGVGNWHTLW